ncbi:MAG: DUF1501 domain-containing protein [Pirellulales bacterium]
MFSSLQHETQVTIRRRGRLLRRDFLRAIPAAGAAAGAALGLVSWPEVIRAQAASLRKAGKACILLWMQGGPSQFETWTPKPGHENGGETKAIATSVAGIEVSENLPSLGKIMHELCLVRSVTSKEGNHPRASFLLHTGYLPAPTVKHPTLGAIVAKELGDAASDLPGFVRIGRTRSTDGGGLLGVEYDPFLMSDAGRLPDNTSLATPEERYERRLKLLDKLESDYASRGGKQEVSDHKKLYSKAARMVLSPKMDAFDLSKEPAAVRESYGDGEFASGCLLARRLVESGVPCVEVGLGNWDTHDDNFERCRQLCGQMDRPAAALIADLKARGMLDDTLVIWMGEFGRSPRPNPRGGRDHFPRAFSMAMAGGGIRGGQVIGSTDASGTDVQERPVTVPDLFQTFCHSLGINSAKENMSSIGRPIKIVDGGEVVPEAFRG